MDLTEKLAVRKLDLGSQRRHDHILVADDKRGGRTYLDVGCVVPAQSVDSPRLLDERAGGPELPFEGTLNAGLR